MASNSKKALPKKVRIKKKPQKDEAFANASLIMGLLFWLPLFNFILGPLAVIFGIVQVKRIKESPSRYGGQTKAIIGIVLGALITILSIIYVILLLFHPELVVVPSTATNG